MLKRLLLVALLPLCLLAQTGRIHVRQAVVQNPQTLADFTDITGGAINSRSIALAVQNSVNPLFQMDTAVADDDLFRITDGSTGMVEMGWKAGASNFGVIRVG